MSDALEARFKAPGPKRILALDGGGSRGLLSLGFLAKLEAHLGERSGNRENFRLSHYFDLIGGTSTGAIIATTLALGWRVDDVVALYFKLLPAIFDRPQVPSFLRIFAPAFKNTALTEGLKENLGAMQLDTDKLQTGLAIHAKRIDTGSAWVLVNNPGWCYFNERDTAGGIPNREFLLRDLVQSSAAAPTYFADVRIPLSQDGKKIEYGFFFDGGVSPNNNPALQLLLTATEPAFGFNWPAGENNLLIWSVGTGYVRSRFEKPKRGRRSSAERIGDFRKLGYSSKVLAALSGYNHDISLQQITTLQALSRPRFPWHVNSEVRMQIHTPLLAAAPALTYQRYDARLEIENKENWRPEHVEALLGGRELNRNLVGKLRQLDIKDGKLLSMLYDAGEALGDAQLIRRDTQDEKHPIAAPAIAPDWPPQNFDPPAWRSAPAPAAPAA